MKVKGNPRITVLLLLMALALFLFVAFKIEAFAVMLLFGLIALLHAFGGKARINQQGQIVLTFGLGIRAFAFGVLVLFIGIVFWITTGGYAPNYPPPSDYLFIIPFVSIMLAILFGFFLWVNYSWFTLDNAGIEHHSPLRRNIKIQWNDVIVVHLRGDSGNREFVIFGPNSKIVIEGQMGGFDEQVKMIKEHIPFEKLNSTAREALNSF